MEISGRITKVLEQRSGTSKTTGTVWVSQTYVLETRETQPRRLAFEVFGEDRIKSMNILPGEDLTVYFDIDAREYNGRWYNSVRAWKVERQVVTDAPPMPTPIDPLPFDDDPPF